MADEILPHIKVVQHPNRQARTYHLSREIDDIDDGHTFGRTKFYRRIFGEAQSDHATAALLGRKLALLPGVTGGQIERYEITVSIGEAFSWRAVGPMVLGEIISTMYPEVNHKTLQVSVSIGWGYYSRSRMLSLLNDDDDGYRTRYQDTVDRLQVNVELGTRPRLDIEHLLDKDAVEAAKQQAASEVVYE